MIVMNISIIPKFFHFKPLTSTRKIVLGLMFALGFLIPFIGNGQTITTMYTNGGLSSGSGGSGGMAAVFAVRNNNAFPVLLDEVAYYVPTGTSYPWSLWMKADRKSTRLNSSHVKISYAVFCLKK